MYEMRRCFIGIKLDDQVLEKIGQVQAEVRRKEMAGNIKWIPIRELAISILTVGELPVSQIGVAIEILKTRIPAFNPMTVSLICVTGIPNPVMPKFVCLTVHGLEPLESLIQDIRSDLANVTTLHENWSYSPVLEIGRIRVFNDQARSAIGRALRMSQDLEAGELVVSGIDLMSHEADSSGPYVEVIGHFPFLT